MIELDIKPVSVNDVWKGKRFKTLKYKDYERSMLFILPRGIYVPKKIELRIVWGLSSTLADIDNPLKPFIDILQKKYGFNDKDIYRLVVDKVVVNKGREFIRFEMVDYEPLR